MSIKSKVVSFFQDRDKPPEPEYALPPEVLAKFKPTCDDPRMIAARERLEHFKSEKSRVLRDLQAPENQPSESSPLPPRAAAEADAQVLLAGGQLADLAIQPSRHAGLLRSLRALEIATEAQEGKIRELHFGIVHEYLTAFAPLALPFEKNVIDAMEALVVALKRKQAFYREVSRCGLTESSGRPGHWQLHYVETALLYGAEALRSVPCLAWLIGERRKLWGLDAEKEGK